MWLMCLHTYKRTQSHIHMYIKNDVHTNGHVVQLIMGLGRRERELEAPNINAFNQAGGWGLTSDGILWSEIH